MFQNYWTNRHGEGRTCKAAFLRTTGRRPGGIGASAPVDVICVSYAVLVLRADARAQITACYVVGIGARVTRLIVVLGDFLAVGLVAPF